MKHSGESFVSGEFSFESIIYIKDLSTFHPYVIALVSQWSPDNKTSVLKVETRCLLHCGFLSHPLLPTPQPTHCCLYQSESGSSRTGPARRPCLSKAICYELDEKYLQWRSGTQFRELYLNQIMAL